MLYDPIDAFFQGITSSIARIVLAIAPLLLALASYALPDPELGSWGIAAFPLVVIGVILTWASQGLLFFFGFFCFLAYLYFSWRFVNTDYPKEVFLSLFVLAFLFFVPLSWVEKFPLWIAIVSGAGGVILYCILGYGLPNILTRFNPKTKNS